MGDTSAKSIRRSGATTGSSIDISDEGGFVAPGEEGTAPSNVVTHQMHKIIHNDVWVVYNPSN
jgi:hypothetical protein